MKTNINRDPCEYNLALCDLEETLFSKTELYSSRGIKVIRSSFAYQYAINFIASSKLRDKIDPSLIGLSHKKAWEEIFGDGPYQIHDKDYDKNAEFDFLCINDASKILARENGIRNSN